MRRFEKRTIGEIKCDRCGVVQRSTRLVVDGWAQVEGERDLCPKCAKQLEIFMGAVAARRVKEAEEKEAKRIADAAKQKAKDNAPAKKKTPAKKRSVK